MGIVVSETLMVAPVHLNWLLVNCKLPLPSTSISFILSFFPSFLLCLHPSFVLGCLYAMCIARCELFPVSGSVDVVVVVVVVVVPSVFVGLNLD